MSEPRLGGDVKGAFALGVVATLVATFVNDGVVAWLLSPVFVGCFLYAAARAPLRYSIYVLTFCALAVEKPTEMPPWTSPFFPIGTLMFLHIKHMTGVSIFFLSGMEYLLIFLLGVSLLRESTGSSIDARGRVETPRPFVKLAYVSLAGSMFTWMYGIATGGDFSKSLWQLEKVIYVPIVFLLCNRGLRGPKDHAVLGKIVLVAAALRSILAIYVVHVTAERDPETGELLLEHATSHHDSMLFAFASLLLVLMVIERADKKALRRLLLIQPLYVWGMIANDRRMVWVQIGLVLVTLYLVTPPNVVKRKIKRALIALSPAIAGYVAAGWGSEASIFKPVGIIRSVVEPDTDASSLWREIENYDILYTFRRAPIFGHGYGHPFWEVIPLPAVPYELEHYCPHNSILGLWAFAGFVGFTMLVLLWAGGVFFAMRAYFATKVPTERVAAVLAVGSVIIYMIQCYGDMGLGAWTGVFLVAPCLSLAGKLAVHAGAWNRPKTRASRPPPATRATREGRAVPAQ